MKNDWYKQIKRPAGTIKVLGPVLPKPIKKG